MNFHIQIKTPENVPRLFDLVKIQGDLYRPAFYFILRDTLVADTLDQATRIAYGAQRWRVVTLRGDLIEVSGAYCLFDFLEFRCPFQGICPLVDIDHSLLTCYGLIYMNELQSFEKFCFFFPGI